MQCLKWYTWVGVHVCGRVYDFTTCVYAEIGRYMYVCVHKEI